jgi:hypothetical protein
VAASACQLGAPSRHALCGMYVGHRCIGGRSGGHIAPSRAAHARRRPPRPPLSLAVNEYGWGAVSGGNGFGQWYMRLPSVRRRPNIPRHSGCGRLITWVFQEAISHWAPGRFRSPLSLECLEGQLGMPSGGHAISVILSNREVMDQRDTPWTSLFAKLQHLRQNAGRT